MHLLHATVCQLLAITCDYSSLACNVSIVLIGSRKPRLTSRSASGVNKFTTVLIRYQLGEMGAIDFSCGAVVRRIDLLLQF